MAVLKKARRWARLVGVVDHNTVPSTYAESIFTLYNWTEYDVVRGLGVKTRAFFPFSEEEIKMALRKADWQVIKDGIFPALVGSPNNAIPLWVMKNNLDRLESHARKIEDHEQRELYHSRILTIKKLLETELPKPSFYAVLAGKNSSC